MHWTGQTSTQARSFVSMHASVMIAMPAMEPPLPATAPAHAPGPCHVPAPRGVLPHDTAGRGASMQLTVFGANGPTGRHLTRLALGEGHGVVAFTRRPDRFPIEHPGLTVAAGDVHDGLAVTRAIVGSDAV